MDMVYRRIHLQHSWVNAAAAAFLSFFYSALLSFFCSAQSFFSSPQCSAAEVTEFLTCQC